LLADTDHADNSNSTANKVAGSNAPPAEVKVVPTKPGAAGGTEEKTSTVAMAFWLLVWMANNILVTVLNKAAFAKVDFKYPYALSTIHMACNIVGAQLYFLLSRTIKPKQIEGSNRRAVVMFSVIFSLNIAIGNTSLRWVSVNFNQVARSLVPVIVMAVSIFYYGKSFSLQRRLAVLPIVLGVALAFYGDMSFTAVGAFYTIFCVILAALKAVVGGELLTGDLKLHEIDLLSKMCPLALLQIGLVSLATGEVTEILGRWKELASGPAPQVVLLSGILSFSLNVSSFIANKVTSALTLCIAANVKQVMLVGFGTVYFGDTVSLLNGLGIMLALAGSFRYGLVSIYEK